MVVLGPITLKMTKQSDRHHDRTTPIQSSMNVNTVTSLGSFLVAGIVMKMSNYYQDHQREGNDTVVTIVGQLDQMMNTIVSTLFGNDTNEDRISTTSSTSRIFIVALIYAIVLRFTLFGITTTTTRCTNVKAAGKLEQQQQQSSNKADKSSLVSRHEESGNDDDIHPLLRPNARKVLQMFIFGMIALYVVLFGNHDDTNNFSMRSSTNDIMNESIVTSSSSSSSSLYAKPKVILSAATSTSDVAGFVPLQDISTLTLRDLQDILSYVTAMNTIDFNKVSYVNELVTSRSTSSPVLKQVLYALDDAIHQSKGIDTLLSSRSKDTDDAGIEYVDALAFSSFVRIFAEWRVLRLIPSSSTGETNKYQMYAMGMNLGKRDLVQNVEKIELAIHEYIIHQQQQHHSAASDMIRSPTIGQILNYEIEIKKHKSLPYLQENSAASGFLWIQRQLQYQTSLFQNILRVQPVSTKQGSTSSSSMAPTFATSKDAVLAAYKATYEPYHGFIVRQIFQKSFQAAPDSSIIVNYMNEPYHQFENIVDDTETFDSMDDNDESNHNVNVDNVINHDNVNSDHITTTSINEHVEHANPFDAFNAHIQNEWNKFQHMIHQVVQQHVQNFHKKELVTSSSTSTPTGDSKSMMKKLGSNDIPSFIPVMQPLLNGLDQLIVKHNMKDPTKC